MELNIQNETSELEVVMLGIGQDRGKPRILNPMSRKHFNNNTFPTDDDIIRELNTFKQVLLAAGVEVLHPTNLLDVEQIFTRDIGFVIGKKFFISNMKKASRKDEQPGMQFLLDQINTEDVIKVEDPAIIEGGDVIVWNDYVFVGISDRTNYEGYEILKSKLPDKKVVAFELVVSDDPDTNILHLDCTFQPIGKDEAIFYEEGFVEEPKILKEIFPEDKLIRVNQEQKVRMFPNVFSIAPNKIVVERGFVELKEELESRNYKVFEVDFKETSKLSGLLRCSTLPLRRK